MRAAALHPAMRDAEAFAGTEFLGLARRAKQDPYRLGLFAKHLEPDERPLCFLPIQGGTLVATDRRVLELRAHLDVHGAWNVKEFLGFEIRRSWAREGIRGFEHVAAPATTGPPGGLEERLVLATLDGTADILVARGPEAVLSREDVASLRAAILGPQA